MARSEDPIVIKKYANRRLYNTGSSTYVTLDDLASMVKAGDKFVVQDAKSGEDITRMVLAQIIFDQEAKEGQNLLPINFLRQLIGFYGDSMQSMIPAYLDYTMNSFTREQANMREQMASMFGAQSVAGFDQIEAQVRRNMEMFQKTMGMFMPFSGTGQTPDEHKKEGKPGPGDAVRQAESGDLQELKDQLAQLKKKLDDLG